MSKSRAALEFNVQWLMEMDFPLSWIRLSFPGCGIHDPRLAGAMFHDFWHDGWTPNLGDLFPGLKIIELHPGGHGVHFHLLLGGEYKQCHIEAIGEPYGFGFSRITPVTNRNPDNVKSMSQYMGKYMGKQRRVSEWKGVRLWSRLGPWPADALTRVKDITVDSPVTRAIARYRRWSGFVGKIPWQKFRIICYNSLVYGAYEKWPHLVHVSLGGVPDTLPGSSETRGVDWRGVDAAL